MFIVLSKLMGLYSIVVTVSHKTVIYGDSKLGPSHRVGIPPDDERHGKGAHQS